MKYHAYFHTQPVLCEQMVVEYDEFVDEQTCNNEKEVPGKEKDER